MLLRMHVLRCRHCKESLEGQWCTETCPCNVCWRNTFPRLARVYKFLKGCSGTLVNALNTLQIKGTYFTANGVIILTLICTFCDSCCLELTSMHRSLWGVGAVFRNTMLSMYIGILYIYVSGCNHRVSLCTEQDARHSIIHKNILSPRDSPHSSDTL